MKLKDVSGWVRVAGEVVRASEQLLDTIATSRRGRTWPLLVGVGLGFGLGALVVDGRAQKLVVQWLDRQHDMPRDGKAAPAPAEARPS